MRTKKLTSLDVACLCAQSADNKKGEDILVLDVHDISSVADYFVIITGQSEPHLKAVRNEIEQKLKDQGVVAKGIDGFPHSQWVVMNYFDVLVHIFAREPREFYALERLWGDAAKVEWQEKVT